MSQATNKEAGFLSEQHFQLLWFFDTPQISLHYNLMYYDLTYYSKLRVDWFDFRSVWVAKKTHVHKV